MWNQPPSPVASSVASSTPQTETSTTVGTVDAIECTALDLCATALTQQEIVNPRWTACNVDTGAGGTVWPMNADYACEKISGPGGRDYKTATGGTVSCSLSKCLGTLVANDGEKTSVHKPLLSAGDVIDKGHALWLDGNVGYIIQKDSPILTAMRTCFQRVCQQHSWNGAIDLTTERGVYNLYVQVAGGDDNVGQAVDVSPMKWRSMSQATVHREAFAKRNWQEHSSHTDKDAMAARKRSSKTLASCESSIRIKPCRHVDESPWNIKN